MKRLWIAAAILVLLLAAAVTSSLALSVMTDELTASLTRAQAMAEEGDWTGAALTTEQASLRFQDSAFYLHVTLRHNDIDAVEAAFREVEQLLLHRERLGEYAAANARLIVQLKLLAESEHFSLMNIL